MGTFHYGTNVETLDDSDLSLLEAVTADMLGRDQSFLATLGHVLGSTHSYWMHPSAHLRFEYDSIDHDGYDLIHLDLQLANAHSDGGVMIHADPARNAD